jgi:hypothetical protein
VRQVPTRAGEFFSTKGIPMTWQWLAALSLVLSYPAAPQNDSKKDGNAATAPKQDAKKTAKSDAATDDAKKSPKSDDESPFKSLTDKASYAIGLNIGRSLKGEGVEVDIAALTRGIKDSLGSAKPLLTDKEIQETMIEFQKEIAGKQGKAQEDFLAENKKKGLLRRIRG